MSNIRGIDFAAEFMYFIKIQHYILIISPKSFDVNDFTKIEEFCYQF
jgi:hypothetical protein